MKKALFFFTACVMTHTAFACKAAFTYIAHSVNNELLKVVINNSSEQDLTTNNTRTYTIINWGDGSVSTSSTSWQEEAENSLLNDVNRIPIHNYKVPGTYKVQLKIVVTDSTSSTQKRIVCTDSVVKAIKVDYSPCATMYTKTKVNDLTYRFTAITPVGATGMTYTWDFNDDTPIEHSATTQHTYKNKDYAITYAIILTATSNDHNCGYVNSNENTLRRLSSGTTIIHGNINDNTHGKK